MPIDPLQARYPRKLAHIARDECGLMAQGGGRDQSVVWADGCAGRFQSDANFGSLQGAFLIKGEHLQGAKKLLSLIHISEPTNRQKSRMPSSA